MSPAGGGVCRPVRGKGVELVPRWRGCPKGRGGIIPIRKPFPHRQACLQGGGILKTTKPTKKFLAKTALLTGQNCCKKGESIEHKRRRIKMELAYNFFVFYLVQP